MNRTLKQGLWGSSVIALLVVIIYFTNNDTPTATVVIFFFSLLLFHLILFRFAKHENIWKSTDYLFEAVAIISLITAVAGLSSASKYKSLQEEFSKRKLAQVQFIYAVESTITNDCNPLKARDDIWTVTPEPIKGECDRIKHFLPQMKFSFDQETGPDNMTSEVNWAYNLDYDGHILKGSWSGIQSRAKELIKISSQNEIALKNRDSSKNKGVIDLSTIEKMFYWYHLLAFFLALKIARISMDIFKK